MTRRRGEAGNVRSTGSAGNVMFIILLALSLFAALSYAVMKSDGSGSAGLDREQASMYASEIMQAAASMEDGIQRMASDGIPLGTIVTGDPGNKFFAGGGSANVAGNDYTNFCTSGTTCLFAADGGGVSIPKLPQNAYLATAPAAFSSYFQGANSYNGVLIDGLSPGAGPSETAAPNVGTAAVDDMAWFYPLKKDVCVSINKKLGISGIPLIAVMPSGAHAACVDAGADGYWYYHVLKAN